MSELDPDVGQLFLLAFDGASPEPVLPLIEEVRLGGLYLSNDNLREPATSVRLLNTLQEAATSPRGGVPLITAADQEGAWSVITPRSTAGPGNLALGQIDPDHTEAMYAVFAAELEAVGVFCDLAPVADVISDPRSPIIGQRSFGESAEEVGVRVERAVRGLHRHKVMAAAKHFPGHGNTETDSHRGLARVQRDAETIRQVDLAPFERAIGAGVDMVMTAHIVFEAFDGQNPATLSRTVLSDVLRGELGFEGLIVSDSFNMNAIRKSYDPAEAAVAAINAGVDLVMLAEERYGDDVGNHVAAQRNMIRHVSDAIRSGEISRARFEQALSRVARLRDRYDLPSRTHADAQRAEAFVGNPEHRAIELAAAREAVRVVFDRKGILPLSRADRLAVTSLVPEGARRAVHDTRGIGPNFSDGFAAFLEALRAQCGVTLIAPGAEPPPGTGTMVAVSENYPLPGKSFDTDAQLASLRALRRGFPGTIVVAGLRDPYDAERVSADAYVTSFGFRAPNARALGEGLFRGGLPGTARHRGS